MPINQRSLPLKGSNQDAETDAFQRELNAHPKRVGPDGIAFIYEASRTGDRVRFLDSLGQPGERYHYVSWGYLRGSKRLEASP